VQAGAELLEALLHECLGRPVEANAKELADQIRIYRKHESVKQTGYPQAKEGVCV
jgi:hypothetical protein